MRRVRTSHPLYTSELLAVGIATAQIRVRFLSGWTSDCALFGYDPLVEYDSAILEAPLASSLSISILTFL